MDKGAAMAQRKKQEAEGEAVVPTAESIESAAETNVTLQAANKAFMQQMRDTIKERAKAGHYYKDRRK